MKPKSKADTVAPEIVSWIGLGLITAGCYMIWPPVAYLVFGAAVWTSAVLSQRGS